MTNVKHSITTTATPSSRKGKDMLKQQPSTTTSLESKLQHGRQLIERNSITKNRVSISYQG